METKALSAEGSGALRGPVTEWPNRRGDSSHWPLARAHRRRQMAAPKGRGLTVPAAAAHRGPLYLLPPTHESSLRHKVSLAEGGPRSCEVHGTSTDLRLSFERPRDSARCSSSAPCIFICSLRCFPSDRMPPYKSCPSSHATSDAPLQCKQDLIFPCLLD